MDYRSTEFDVDSSSCFPSRVQTNKQSQIDATECSLPCWHLYSWHGITDDVQWISVSALQYRLKEHMVSPHEFVGY